MSKIKHIFPPLYFTLLTLFMTFPLVTKLGHSILGGLGDNVYFVWLVRWYQRVIFEGQGSLFFNPWMNYPEGWNLTTTDTTLATAAPGALFSVFFGPVAGYNLAMLLTFVLSGWAMYLWVVRLTGSRGAGLLAGTVYAFFPFRMAHFVAGHLNLSGTQWFPLYFLGLYDLLQTRDRLAWKPALLAAVSLGLIGLSSMYYLYMVLLISAVFVLAYLLFGGWRAVTRLQWWRGAAVFGIASLPLIALTVYPFFQLSSQGGVADRSLEYASLYSASPMDFFLPSTDHFLFGKWIVSHFDRSLLIEGTFYLGLTVLVLAIVGVLKSPRAQKAYMGAAVCVICVSFVLALGTNLHWNNQPVSLSIPPLLQPLVGKSETLIYLPAAWFFQHLPFYAKMRALMRIGLFALVFIAFLSGVGASWLLAKLEPTRRKWVTFLLIGLVLFEFYPGPYANFARVTHRPVDEWLAAQPGSGAVLQIPFYQAEEQDQLYYTLVHKKPIVGGFFNANQPAQYLAIKPILDQFPSSEAVSMLPELKVEYVVVDTSQYEDFLAVEDQILSLGLVLLTDQAGQRVYSLSAP